MRSRPEHIVELLREAAEDEAEDAPSIPMTESVSWEAADLIEWLMTALALIRGGVSDPATVAADALDDAKWRAAGPPEPPLPPMDAEQSEWVRLTTEQIIARLKGQAD